MKPIILFAKTAGLLLCLLLLSISSMAQDRNSSNQVKDLTAIEVFTTQPVQQSKSDMLMNAETSTFPRPETSGNRDLDIENYRVQLSRWAKENPNQFLALDEKTRELINNQQYAVLFDQAVSRMKANSQNER